ncbi:DEAD/DEAH box helicase [Acetomicrobium mobile]|uniref:DEAD/DEAH box helicase n=1 Tax=Acetomicrobium mobile TaxID=97477 RepID=UPI0026F18C45|nr:AAA domain-containing protein [Acetomicrobium mobile]
MLSIPKRVLKAWIASEALTPHLMPRQRNGAENSKKLLYVKESPEPWVLPQYGKQRGESAFYWLLYFGELKLDSVMKYILKKYPDNAEDERSYPKGTAALAAVLLDEQGKLIEEKTFLSSFAWSYGQLISGCPENLVNFQKVEANIKSNLEKRLKNNDDNGNRSSITHKVIDDAFVWLIAELKIPEKSVLKKFCAFRLPQFEAKQEPPDMELLNSFFIEDLSVALRAFDEDRAGKALKKYMQMESSKVNRVDVAKNIEKLKDILAPDKMPLVRWPSNYPLVLMQQAAVNHVSEELANGGLAAVNGPPGTGKTTLLRDVIAKVILDRAVAMSKYDDPAKAFKLDPKLKMRVDQNNYIDLYRLDESIMGYEIVVASSNNKAVENVSREIPSIDAIAKELQGKINYFRTLSDELMSGSTWGMVAAVLGNSAHCRLFAKTFYHNEKVGIRHYLNSILNGYDSTKLSQDDIVAIENPPSNRGEALNRWHAACKKFSEKLAESEKLRKEAQMACSMLGIRRKVIRLIAATQEQLGQLSDNYEKVKEEEKAARDELVRAETAETEVSLRVETIERKRPCFFVRLFCTRKYRNWRDSAEQARISLNEAQRIKKQAEKSLQDKEERAAEQENKLKKLKKEKLQHEAHLVKLEKMIAEERKKVGDNFADDDFWMQEDEILQLKSPWLYDDWQAVRSDLFAEAFNVHRAFIDAAAKQLSSNLRGVIEIIGGKALPGELEPLRRHLWSTLFLIVPVISATFASIGRLFGSLDKEQLGWLLIDEAGQATPQAAVGAIWRARRVLVVGDPLQIQPVVTMPPELISKIFVSLDFKKEEERDWAAPEASVQTLADKASFFGTCLKIEDEAEGCERDIWVGCPLRVHRRCHRPMFDISNNVAYNGMMIYGTIESDSEIGKILGDSRWLHVPLGGNVNEKWSEDEGNFAFGLLRQLLNEGINNPDIFFISPFRIVADNLRKLIMELIMKDSTITRPVSNDQRWIHDRVGTIHTFQGKEADTVVIVLGAPSDDGKSCGARMWAGQQPNLLNVAVTRAKRRLYVIGNREAWKNAGYFQYLDRGLE